MGNWVQMIKGDKIVQVECYDAPDVALYIDGVLFREWERDFECSCDSPTEILEGVGLSVEERYTKETYWTFPKTLAEVPLLEDKCKGCDEYVCRTCT